MTSDFLSLISLGWVVTFPDSYCTVFTFCSWLDLLGVLLAFWIFNPKIFKLLQTADQGLQVSVPLKSSLDHTLNFCRNLVTFHSKSMCQKVSLTGLLRWSSLQTKEGKRHTEFHLWSTGVSTECQKCISVFQIRQDFFSNKKYDPYKCWSCAMLCEAVTFLMENIYVKFDGMVYEEIVEIPMDTNQWPHSHVKRYLSIFTIDNPEFEKHTPDIYPAELQLNKANTSDKKILSWIKI